jgi:hypothetical protein
MSIPYHRNTISKTNIAADLTKTIISQAAAGTVGSGGNRWLHYDRTTAVWRRLLRAERLF